MELIKERDQRTRITLIDGTDLTVQVIFSDRIRYETDRKRRDWPAMTEAPMLAMAYTAFLAAKRAGLLHDHVATWERFLDATIDVSNVTVDGRQIVWRDGQAFVESADDETYPALTPAHIPTAEFVDDADPTTPETCAVS